MQGASAVLINVTGGMDMTLFEVDEAANRIRREVDVDSVIIFGSTFDEKLEGVMRVSIVATGIEANLQTRERPTFLQAPITRRSTIISAPTAVPTAPAAAATATDSVTAAAAEDAPSASMDIAPADPVADNATTPQAPATVEAWTAMSTAKAEQGDAEHPKAEQSAKAEQSEGREDGAIMPGFVPTKASRSRLAFLASGRATAKADAEPGSSDEADDRQISIDEAIAKERATSFGNGMPASPDTATPDTATPDTATPDAATPDLAPAATSAADMAEPATATAKADDAADSVMVADTPEQLTATRAAFIPGAPAAMPETETVPATTAASGKTSLINKISRLWTEKPQEEAGSPRREPAVEAAGVDIAPVKATAASDAADKDAAPSILDLPRADAMNRMPEPAGTTTLDRPADDLEIPAFLRRQAN